LSRARGDRRRGLGDCPLRARCGRARSRLHLAALRRAGQSWNWISGYAGNISFGHAIFFGCGAYASALMVTHGPLTVARDSRRRRGRAALAIVTGFPTLALRGHLLLDRDDRGRPRSWTRWCGRSPGSACATGFELPISSGWAALQFADKGPLHSSSRWCCLRQCRLRRSRSNGRWLGYYLRALRANHAAARPRSASMNGAGSAGVRVVGRHRVVCRRAVCPYTLFVDPPSTIALGVSIDIALIGVVGGIGTLWTGRGCAGVRGPRQGRRARTRRHGQRLRPW